MEHYPGTASTGSRPRVTIGLPVYNGDRHLAFAVESVLGQTYRDFELIISDNASTDSTPAICARYAARDPRVRLIRNATNIGAARNFNQVFQLSTAPYFQWLAHDDGCEERLLEKCIEVLDRDPTVVLCYAREVSIDDAGRFLRERPYPLSTDLERPSGRLRALISINRGSPPVFGVIRSAALRQTRLFGPYDASDQVLLAELILRGKFHEIGENLFLHREHQGRSVHQHPDRYTATLWFDPSRRGAILLPEWRLSFEYLRAIHRAPLGVRERLRCLAVLVRWVQRRWRRMLRDVRAAAIRLTGSVRVPERGLGV